MPLRSALVMNAFLFLSAVFGLYSGQIEFETIRRATFFVLGLAPLVFLVGLVHARLARSAVADLVVELRADPAPADLRDALARALRDPSLTLAYWLPDFGSYADLDGRPVDVPATDGRSATMIDREGEHVAVLLHDRALEDEPELLAGVGAAAEHRPRERSAAGRARGPPGGGQGLARPGDRGRAARAAAARARISTTVRSNG